MPTTVDIHRSKNGKAYVYTGGFDSFVSVVDSATGKVVKTQVIKDALLTFPEIVYKPVVTPFVYSITTCPKSGCHLVSLETGNVLGFYDDLLQKPRFCIEGHGTKVIRRSTHK